MFDLKVIKGQKVAESKIPKAEGRSRVYLAMKQGLQAGAAVALDTIIDEEKQKQP